MLIRSQDKKSILNLDNVMQIIVAIPPCSANEYAVIGNGAVMATYSTEEKAIKVLDMIQKAYCVMRRADCLNTGTVSELAQIRKESREEIVNELRKVYVFQMPIDEEVSND